MILTAQDLELLIWRAELSKNCDDTPDVSARILAILKEDLLELALDVEFRQSSNFTSCGDICPGYLRSSVDKWNLFVPWHLAEALPGEDLIRVYLKIGESISAFEAKDICISGSAAIGKGKVEIGDLDFSQYTTLLGYDFSTDLERLRAPTAEKILLKLSYGRGDAGRTEHPWENWSAVLARIASCSEYRDAERLLLEFLIKSDRFGLIPSSVVVMMSDLADRSRGASRTSFVFQEIFGTDTVDKLPTWSLIDPSQIGEYLSFLLDQIAHYKEMSPIKAVKRSLSLAYILGLDDATDAAVAILASDECSAFIRRKRCHDVDELLDLMDGERVAEWSETRKISGEDDHPSLDPASVNLMFQQFFSSLKRELVAEGLAGARWDV